MDLSPYIYGHMDIYIYVYTYIHTHTSENEHSYIEIEKNSKEWKSRRHVLEVTKVI